MDTQVPDISSIPAPSTSFLKKLAKRSALAALAVGAGWLVYTQVTKPAEDNEASTQQFN